MVEQKKFELHLTILVTVVNTLQKFLFYKILIAILQLFLKLLLLFDKMTICLVCDESFFKKATLWIVVEK